MVWFLHKEKGGMSDDDDMEIRDDNELDFRFPVSIAFIILSSASRLLGSTKSVDQVREE